MTCVGRRTKLALLATALCLSVACRSKDKGLGSDAASVAPVVPSVIALPSEPNEAPNEGPGSARGKVADTPAVVADDPKKAFVDNRVAKAKAGLTEIVGMRIWHCGPSCTCPAPCIQTVSEETGLTWIDLHDDAGEAVAITDWASAEITGRFTGRTRSVPAGGGSGPQVVVPEFRLTSTPTIVGTAMGSPDLEGAHAKVLLEGPLAKKLVPKVTDAKPFLVVAGAFPLADATRADTDASALFEKLDKLGIHDAERYDSRAFTGLACCFDVVLGGRFADLKAAEARVKQLKGRGVSAYAKRGF